MSTHSAGDAAVTAVSDTVDHVFRHYPQVARRAGRHDLDGVLSPVAPRPLAELDRLRAAVSAADPGDDRDLRADLAAAGSVLDHERFLARGLGREFPGPLDWLAETDVSSYLTRQYAPIEERVDALAAHLAQLPGYLREAETTLGGQLAAGERLRGVEQARVQAVAIRNVAAALPTEHATATVVRAAEDAATACEGFARAVAATTPARGVFGPELLAEFLSAAERIDTAPADLLDAARSEVDSVAGALDKVAAGLGATRAEIPDLLAAEVSDGSVLETFDAMLERVKRFWLDIDVVTVESSTPVVVRHPVGPSATAAVTFDPVGALEDSGLPHVIHVPDLSGDLRAKLLNDPMLELVAVHEAYAGHLVHVEAGRRGPSVLRTCVPWFPGFAEGWAHYTEELAVEHGLADGRPLVEAAQLTLALEAATRLHAFLSVHLGQAKFIDAVELAARTCGWSAERAAREVLIVVSDPFGAMYTLGKIRLRELRARSGGGKDFHDGLVRAGLVPLSTAWDHHTDDRENR